MTQAHNGIAFVPLHDSTNQSDVSEYHRPQAEAWCAERSLPAPIAYNNRQPPTVRARLIVKELARHRTQLDSVAFFGHAGAIAIQAGFHIDDIPGLALLLVSACKPNGVIEIHAIDPVIDTTGLCKDGAFADKLRAEMSRTGRWKGQVVAHAVSDHGRVARVFEGPANVPGVWVPVNGQS